MPTLRVWCAIVLIWFVALAVGVRPMGAQAADDLATLAAQVSKLYDQGKCAAAFQVAERYAVLAHEKHGEEHIQFATAISWLAYAYRAQGRYTEAEPLYKHSLAIFEKALGSEHPSVGISLNNLAGSISSKAVTPRPSCSTSAASPSKKRRWAPGTQMSAPRSTTWPKSTLSRPPHYAVRRDRAFRRDIVDGGLAASRQERKVSTSGQSAVPSGVITAEPAPTMMKSTWCL